MTVFESWSVSHTAAVLLALSMAAGAAFAFKPRKRNRLIRRTHNLRKQLLPDPWSGGIVREQKFYTPHWNASVGRAYRAVMKEG